MTAPSTPAPATPYFTATIRLPHRNTFIAATIALCLACSLLSVEGVILATRPAAPAKVTQCARAYPTEAQIRHQSPDAQLALFAPDSQGYAGPDLFDSLNDENGDTR
jgi:hypothetical protein